MELLPRSSEARDVKALAKALTHPKNEDNHSP